MTGGMIDRATIGAELRRLRELRGLTLDQVTENMHVAKTTLSAIERGASGPSIERYVEFAWEVEATLTVLLLPREQGERWAELAALVQADPERLAEQVRLLRAWGTLSPRERTLLLYMVERSGSEPSVAEVVPLPTAQDRTTSSSSASSDGDSRSSRRQSR